MLTRVFAVVLLAPLLARAEDQPPALMPDMQAAQDKLAEEIGSEMRWRVEAIREQRLAQQLADQAKVREAELQAEIDLLTATLDLALTELQAAAALPLHGRPPPQ